MPKPNHVIERETVDAVAISEGQISRLEVETNFIERAITNHENHVARYRNRLLDIKDELETARQTLKKEKSLLKRVKRVKGS